MTISTFDTRVIKVLGKGSKQRLIPFADELEEGLKIYVARRDAEVVRKDKAFFVDQRGQRVKRGAVQNSVRASLAKVTSMKKTFATRAAAYICHRHAKQ